MEDKYLTNCIEENDELFRCLKLLENTECLDDPDCVCDSLVLYKRHTPCKEITIQCSEFTGQVIYPQFCQEPLTAQINY